MSVRGDVGELDFMHTAAGNGNGAATWEDSLQFVKKLIMHLPHDPATLHLDIYLEERKAEVHAEAGRTCS